MADQRQADRRPGAIVTGASRGIGKASAIALAQAGFDVAITARTIHRGDSELPGSLEETAEAIEAAGGTAHRVPMDLLDTERLPLAAQACVDALGSVDVLVNNAVWVSTGGHVRFLDLEPDHIEKRLFALITAQLLFAKPVVAVMVSQGHGAVLNMSSAAAYAPPFAQPGEGGWNLPYTVGKAGFHRIAVQLEYEYGDAGIRALNLQPGAVATERVKLRRGAVSKIADIGVSTEVIGATVAHVATHLDDYRVDETVQLQDVAVHLGLLDAPADFTKLAQ